MFAIERQKEILNIINTVGRISVSEIQRRFLVGYETAKRDLMLLEERGAIQRTYGGAIKKDNSYSIDNIMAQTANKALWEIKPGEKIFLDNSKYSFYIAQNLNILCYIVTYNINLAHNILKKNNHLAVEIIGGQLDKDGNAYNDEFVNKYQSKLFDKAFISGGGYTAENGLSTDSERLGKMLCAAVKLSNETICMLEEKFIGNDCKYQIAGHQLITRMYTEKDN